MTSPQPSTVLSGLIRLQQIDDQRLKIERRLAEGPQLLERRTQGLRNAEEKLHAALERAKKLKATLHQHELDLKVKEGEIQKLIAQQGIARTNQEYKAVGDHIDRVKKESSAIEDRVLQAYGDVEKAEEDDKRLKGRVQEALDEAGLLNAQWAKDEAEYRAELASIVAQRAEFAKTIPAGPLSVYEQAARNRDGKAVVPVENGICMGCRMRTVPNDMARLLSAKELIVCKSCGRIVYLA